MEADLMSNICQQVVDAARYLQEVGLSERQLTSLHHRSTETFNSAIRYWSVDREPRPRSLDYAYRLRFIAREHKGTNQSLDILVARALSKWPVSKL